MQIWFSQFLWFTESESESFLQPNLHISGNVATKRSRDLWKPDDRLRQQDLRTNEEEVSKLDGWQGAHNIPHTGFNQS